jgi:hypothetical protein
MRRYTVIFVDFLLMLDQYPDGKKQNSHRSVLFTNFHRLTVTRIIMATEDEEVQKVNEEMFFVVRKQLPLGKYISTDRLTVNIYE